MIGQLPQIQDYWDLFLFWAPNQWLKIKSILVRVWAPTHGELTSKILHRPQNQATLWNTALSALNYTNNVHISCTWLYFSRQPKYSREVDATENRRKLLIFQSFRSKIKLAKLKISSVRQLRSTTFLWGFVYLYILFLFSLCCILFLLQQKLKANFNMSICNSAFPEREGAERRMFRKYQQA